MLSGHLGCPCRSFSPRLTLLVGRARGCWACCRPAGHITRSPRTMSWPFDVPVLTRNIAWCNIYRATTVPQQVCFTKTMSTSCVGCLLFVQPASFDAGSCIAYWQCGFSWSPPLGRWTSRSARCSQVALPRYCIKAIQRAIGMFFMQGQVTTIVGAMQAFRVEE